MKGLDYFHNVVNTRLKRMTKNISNGTPKRSPNDTLETATSQELNKLMNNDACAFMPVATTCIF
jgi:hypothetical protein